MGPWCFLDRFGPLTFNEGKPMDVAPHPHIGLQTVTWLLAGEVVHDDSLGYESLLRPGGVNVMTSGAGSRTPSRRRVTTRDDSMACNSGRLFRTSIVTCPPVLPPCRRCPRSSGPSGIVQIFAGELEGAASPAPYFSALLGADVQVHPRHELMLPLNPAYEHAILVMSGDCALDGEPLEQRMLYYLGTARTEACFSSQGRRTSSADRRPAVS